MADIVSPLPGVFYRKPAPGKDDFVSIGDSVEVGQTLGIVEVMKQFTEVKSHVAGQVSAFNVDNEGTVSPGDVIAVVDES